MAAPSADPTHPARAELLAYSVRVPWRDTHFVILTA